MFGLISSCTGFAISILFPTFASYKAIKKNDALSTSAWLMYWVVYSAATVVEKAYSPFIAFIPFYSELRVFFLLWLVIPDTGGVVYCYMRYIHNILSNHEEWIESHFEAYTSLIRSYGAAYFQKIYSWKTVQPIDADQPREIGLANVWQRLRLLPTVDRHTWPLAVSMLTNRILIADDELMEERKKFFEMQRLRLRELINEVNESEKKEMDFLKKNKDSDNEFENIPNDGPEEAVPESKQWFFWRPRNERTKTA